MCRLDILAWSTQSSAELRGSSRFQSGKTFGTFGSSSGVGRTTFWAGVLANGLDDRWSIRVDGPAVSRSVISVIKNRTVLPAPDFFTISLLCEALCSAASRERHTSMEEKVKWSFLHSVSLKLFPLSVVSPVFAVFGHTYWSVYKQLFFLPRKQDHKIVFGTENSFSAEHSVFATSSCKTIHFLLLPHISKN